MELPGYGLLDLSALQFVPTERVQNSRKSHRKKQRSHVHVDHLRIKPPFISTYCILVYFWLKIFHDKKLMQKKQISIVNLYCAKILVHAIGTYYKSR